MRISRLAGLLALALAGASLAAIASQPAPLRFDEVRAQQAELRTAAKVGTGVFEHMSESSRREMFSRQEHLLALIEGKQTPDELGPNEKVAVFNALESIEAIINRAEDKRIVCRRERVTGSNRKVRVCKSVAQLRREREESRDNLDSGRYIQQLRD